MKALRYLVFIPIIYLIIGLINWLIPITLLGIISLSKFWMIFFLVLYSGLAVALINLLPGGITWLAAKLSPSKRFAFYTTFIFSLLIVASNIFRYWAMFEVSEDGTGVFIRILLSFLTVGVTSSICIGAGIGAFDKDSVFLSVLTVVGMMIFYMGIFLVFCLLATKISFINPEKTYLWFSGIWHGLFVIPHWILSWFSDDIYCKAPNSTAAYSVWWWISFIFSTLGLLGGSGNRYS